MTWPIDELEYCSFLQRHAEYCYGYARELADYASTAGSEYADQRAAHAQRTAARAGHTARWRLTRVLREIEQAEEAVETTCRTDGCNHGDCEAAAAEAEMREEADARYDRWLHDAYDRAGDR